MLDPMETRRLPVSEFGAPLPAVRHWSTDVCVARTFRCGCDSELGRSDPRVRIGQGAPSSFEILQRLISSMVEQLPLTQRV